MSAPSYINIVATNVVFDASQTPLAKGTILFEPTMRLQLAEANAQILRMPVARQIVTGTMQGTLKLANTAIGSPSGGGYDITITDSASGRREVYQNVLIAADEDGNWDLATLQTGLYTEGSPVQLVVGPTGPTGLSAYDLALTAGFGGSQTDFALALSALVESWLNGALPRTQWILADANANKFALSISAGSEQIAPYAGATVAIPLYLADTLTSDVWQLTVIDGAETLMPAPVGVSGLATVLFLDPLTGSQFRLTAAGGAITTIPA